MLKQEFTKKLRRAMQMERLKIGISICLVLVGITAVPVALGRWYLSFRAGDLAGSPLQTGTGIVTKVTVRLDAEYSKTDYVALIRVGQREVEKIFSSPVREGQRIRITYQVGKSGHVYIKRAVVVDTPPPRFSDL